MHSKQLVRELGRPRREENKRKRARRARNSRRNLRKAIEKKIRGFCSGNRRVFWDWVGKEDWKDRPAFVLWVRLSRKVSIVRYERAVNRLVSHLKEIFGRFVRIVPRAVEKEVTKGGICLPPESFRSFDVVLG